jgi:hypothetical protein
MSGSAHGIAPVQGNNSPDKEFRYLRQHCYLRPSDGGDGHFCRPPYVAIGLGLYLHQLGRNWAWRAVSEGSAESAVFPADRPHRMDCHRPCIGSVPPDTRMFQHLARFYNGLEAISHRYSYGRRLPALQFRASLPKELTPPLNVPAPGRRQCIYMVLRLRMHLCF